MKTASLFSFVLNTIISLAVMVPQASEGAPHRKDLGKCPECKTTVYSYYKVTRYKKSRPVYGWETSGHQDCEKKMAAASAEAEAKAAAAKSGSDDSVPLAKPQAYGGGSGHYEPSGYGGGYGGGYHGHPLHYPAHRCRSGCGHGGFGYYDNSFGYGLGYGSGTVVRSVRETRSTPSTLGLFGGFPGTATRSYTTQTQVSRRGGFGGIWGGGWGGGFSGCR